MQDNATNCERRHGDQPVDHGTPFAICLRSKLIKETRRLQCLRATLYEPSRRTTNAVRSSVKLLRDSLAQRNSYQDNRKTP